MTGEQQPKVAAITDDGVLRSHNLAELAGTTPRALRHYHKIGLLPEVPRDPNGYRRYSPRDLVRVLRIRQLAASGMPLRKIGSVLEQDASNQDDLLAELDSELEEQVERIQAQRKMIADLRRLQVQTARFSDTERTTATQQLDQDVWTLVTATGGVDADTATAMLDELRCAPLSEQAAAWYPEFEKLETQTRIDAASADQLAERIASFADAAMEATGFTPADEGQPVTALIAQMHADALSPAQQDVWNRFLPIIEQRWKSAPVPPESSGGNVPK